MLIREEVFSSLFTLLLAFLFIFHDIILKNDEWGKGKSLKAILPKIKFKNFYEKWNRKKLQSIAPLRGGFAFKSEKSQILDLMGLLEVNLNIIQN